MYMRIYEVGFMNLLVERRLQSYATQYVQVREPSSSEQERKSQEVYG